MITRIREAGLVWPCAFTAVAFAILLALGNWQWQRMHWKQGLLRELRTAEKASPLPIEQLIKEALRDGKLKIERVRFRRVIVRGVLEHQAEMHVWAPAKSGAAWSVVTPLRFSSQTSQQLARLGYNWSHVFIVRGTVPARTKSPTERRTGQITGIIEITGRVRLDQPNDWAGAPDHTKNEWFTRDLARMSAHLRKGTSNVVGLPSMFIEAENAPSSAAAPQPDLKVLRLANRHLEYALTWWGLAATLLGVFAVFARSRLKMPTKA